MTIPLVKHMVTEIISTRLFTKTKGLGIQNFICETILKTATLAYRTAEFVRDLFNFSSILNATEIFRFLSKEFIYFKMIICFVTYSKISFTLKSLRVASEQRESQNTYFSRCMVRIISEHHREILNCLKIKQILN